MDRRDRAHDHPGGLYADAPPAQADKHFSFRSTHAHSFVRTQDIAWRYTGCGQGERALLFLPDAFLEAEMSFNQILTPENDWLTIARKMTALSCEGVAESAPASDRVVLQLV